ncbi:hypothetical protein FLM48_02435 [Shewanella sp. Scap07]|uniref:hypothetical protein n=1 Tax=Shewanella sp. Scap07 TaxID=2589987 RepID=UPI0015BF1790|nr:hypothetical protein [Shewanella sp. Scap07]QLE84040.1 hypothetical protein FLM48_02435 [Shewanella sp. Scap07]
MKPNSDGKYIFKSINFASVFLPSPADVCQLLGLPDNFVKMLPAIEAHYELPLNVSRSSRAEMTRQGVAKPTIKKLSKWLELLPIPLKRMTHVPTMLKTYRAMLVGSNAGPWYSASYGLGLSSHDSELTTLFDFIDARAKADYQMVKGIKHQIKQRIIDKDDSNGIWQAQLASWQKHSLVSAEQLVCYSLYAATPDAPAFKTEQEGIAVLKAAFHLTFDFYLSAIAHFELGLSLYYMRCGAKEVNEPHRSLFSSAIHTYAVADEKCTCFSAMLNELRTILAKNGLESSWRALAAYIDIEEAGHGVELLSDKQYRQLNYWRNGEDMPSANKLRRFVSNLMSALGGNDVDSVLIYLRIARGIDTLVARSNEQAKDERAILIIAEVLAEYTRYFEHYKQNYTTKDVQIV